MPDGSDLPQGAGYGSFGAPRATDAMPAMMTRTFILMFGYGWRSIDQEECWNEDVGKIQEAGELIAWVVTSPSLS
jgi:hypothetical protein